MQELLDAYANGLPYVGWQRLFYDGHKALDDLKLPKALANYGHALCFGDTLDAIHSGRYLWEHLPAEFQGRAQQGLKEELGLIQLACLQGEALNTYLRKGYVEGAVSELSWTPNEARVDLILREKQGLLEPISDSDPWIRKILPFAQRVQEFKEKQASLWKLYQQHQVHCSRPFYPVHFRAQDPLSPQQEFPVEPADHPWESLLSELPNPAILRFHHPLQLLQCLQFAPLADTLCERKHLIYIDSLYPNNQLRLQPVTRRLAKSASHSDLHSVLQQSREELCGDTPVADALYHHLRHEHLKREHAFLGESRFLALRAKLHQYDWHDSHKARPLEALLCKQDLDSRLASYLDKNHPQVPKRKACTKRLRLTHVVPQVVAGGHAPSKLLKTLLENHDTDRFELSLFVTERLQLHLAEYPYPTHFSPPSAERGGKILQSFQAKGIPVFVDDAQLGFAASAQRLVKGIQSLSSDVVVFHGPDEINLVAARTCGAPLCVFFEHGTLPDQSGFDLVISSTEDTARQYKNKYLEMGSKLVGVPFVLDIRSQWADKAPRKESMGLPEWAKIMTTISNHLEGRLGPEMLWAIIEILNRIPDAYYCPMGPIMDEEKFMAPFQDAGVAERVRPLGTQAEPSQLARCMHLYLNEFPFGSCIGMLDAMAAGCPPVTMYDPDGPPQARYGGDYFGMDRAVTSRKKEDYVELACRLLSDENLYSEWSTHARERYDKRADVKAYVGELEQLMLEELEARGRYLKKVKGTAPS